MKRQIENPYNVNYKLYAVIMAWTALGIVIGNILQTYWMITDIIKNLSYGCFASTVVALLIEVQSIKDKNIEANKVYDAIYEELRFSIGEYLECWSRICKAAYKKQDIESHTWYEWYQIVRDEYQKCDKERQERLLSFFTKQLLVSVEEVNKALYKIEQEEHFLMQSHAFEPQMDSIIRDFKFEFQATKMDLTRELNSMQFWEAVDASNDDLVKYIGNWADTAMFNEMKFEPYGFWKANGGDTL